MTQAVAQGGEAATGQSAIDEIIVTATKRNTKLQETAMAISVLSSDSIEKRGLVGMDDYLKSLPGVDMQDRGASQNNVIIRGIASDPQSEDSTVGIYFGETPVTGLGSTSVGDVSGSADIKLVDVDRIEVLRGPQGTLYGSGSMGGTVRIIPKEPNLENIEGVIQARYSNTGEQGGDNSMVQGVLNIPLIEDTLAIRAVAYQYDNSGFINNVAGSRSSEIPAAAAAVASGATAQDKAEIGTDQYRGFRLSALWQPSDVLKVGLSYLNQDIEQEGFPETNSTLAGDFEQVRMRTGPDGDRDEFMGNEIDITNLVFEYDLGWGQFTSSSSWVDYDSENESDLSPFFLPAYAENNGSAKVFFEELRLSSKLDGPINFLVGFYYEDNEFESDSAFFWNGAGPSFPLTTPTEKQRDTEQKAFFGELSYDFSSTLSATLGIRHFDYDQLFVQEGNVQANALKDESGQVYKFNVKYMPSDDSLIYAQWAEGFRLGLARGKPNDLCDINNDGILDDVGFAPPEGVDSDTSESYEIGFKTSFAENRATLNVALYRINWQGMPVTVTLPSCGSTVTLNASESVSEGVELDFQMALSDKLQLDFSASYGEAELTQDAENLGVDGDPLPGSADFNTSIGIEYQFAINGLDSFSRLDFTYVGDYYHNLAEAGQASGGYSLLNLKTGINVNENIDLDIFVNNLTNSDDFTWVETILGADRGYRLRPRTIGISLGYQF